MYNFYSNLNEIEYKKLGYREEVKSTIAYFESLLDHCLDEALQKAKEIVDASGIMQKVNQSIQDKATKAVIGKLAEKGVKVVGNEAEAELAGAVANTGMHFVFMYKNNREKKNLERAKKLVGNVEKWGGIEPIKQVVIGYLVERFKPLLVELANTQNCLKDLSKLVDFFATATVALLRKYIPKSESEHLDTNYLHDHLFPTTLQTGKSNVLKNLLQTKLDYKVSMMHRWNCKGLVYRSPVCTPEGAWLTQQGDSNQAAKYPFQRLPISVAKKYGFISARLNLKGDAINQDEISLVPPLNKAKQELQKILTENEKKLKENIMELSKQEKWQETLKNVSTNLNRVNRDLLYKKLVTKEDSAAEITHLFMRYCVSLCQENFGLYVEKNYVADQAEALGFIHEVTWLEQLSNELEQDRKSRMSGLDNSNNNQSKSKKLSKLENENKILLENLAFISQVFSLLKSLRQYCRIKTEFAFNSFIVPKKLDPIIAPQPGLLKRVGNYAKGIFSKQKDNDPEAEFQRALDFYTKSEEKSEYKKCAIDLLTELINSLETKRSRSTQDEELLLQCLILRGLAYQSYLSQGGKYLFCYSEALADAESVLKKGCADKTAFFLKVTSLLGMNKLEETKIAIDKYTDLFPHDNELKTLQERWEKQNSENKRASKSLLNS